MEITLREVSVSLTFDDAIRLADDLNVVASHIAEILSKVGDIDTGDPLAELSDAAYRIDNFRMALEGLRRAHH